MAEQIIIKSNFPSITHDKWLSNGNRVQDSVQAGVRTAVGDR